MNQVECFQALQFQYYKRCHANMNQRFWVTFYMRSNHLHQVVDKTLAPSMFFSVRTKIRNTIILILFHSFLYNFRVITKIMVKSLKNIFKLTLFKNSSAHILALELTHNFISEISLSISSMKWITKSISLWRYISSVWKLVIKKLMSYP